MANQRGPKVAAYNLPNILDNSPWALWLIYILVFFWAKIQIFQNQYHLKLLDFTQEMIRDIFIYYGKKASSEKFQWEQIIYSLNPDSI